MCDVACAGRVVGDAVDVDVGRGERMPPWRHRAMRRWLDGRGSRAVRGSVRRASRARSGGSRADTDARRRPQRGVLCRGERSTARALRRPQGYLRVTITGRRDARAFGARRPRPSRACDGASLPDARRARVPRRGDDHRRGGRRGGRGGRRVWQVGLVTKQRAERGAPVPGQGTPTGAWCSTCSTSYGTRTTRSPTRTSPRLCSPSRGGAASWRRGARRDGLDEKSGPGEARRPAYTYTAYIQAVAPLATGATRSRRAAPCAPRGSRPRRTRTRR